MIPLLSSLTPDQKRVLIAEACGWTKVSMTQPWTLEYPEDFPLIPCGTHPSIGRPEGVPKRWGPVPEYLSCLNACHEMEKVPLAREDGTWGTYIFHLGELCRETPDRDGIPRSHAPASVRCDAFLLAMGLARLE